MFDEFNEIESFYHDITMYGANYTIIYGSYDENFGIVYLREDEEYDNSFNSDCFLIKIDNYYLKIKKRFVRFKSPKTKGWVTFDLKMKLEDFIDIIKSPIDLELYEEHRVLNFDNIILGEDLIIKYDIEKIRKQIQRFETLRLFL
jgi:hypothetical protein